MSALPKKSLGQHWLHDEASLDAIVEAAEVSAGDTVLEVGPGLGTLTKKLCQKVKKVIAVELDDELAASLHKNLNRMSSSGLPAGRQGLTRGSSKELDYPIKSDNDSFKNLEVINQSILDFNLTSLPKDYKVCANIPYYLTSNLIRCLLESSNPPSVIALLVQKEVAQRVAAEPGDMSILAVASQLYAEVELKEVVPAKLFTPPPKVDSQIIQLKLRSEPLFPDVDMDTFFKIVKAGFSEKRKKLRSSLSGGLNLQKSEVDEWLKVAGLSENARAQELSLAQWHKLYHISLSHEV